MSEEHLQRQTRQNCCRLCLAPDSECISILNSYAADKEPLAAKILHCVNIKVSPNDGLSLRICHACISYLNSWQSFKNRCIASQGKQMNWLEFTKRQQLLDNNVSISTISTKSSNRQQQHRQQQQQQHLERDHFHQESNLPSSILDGITSLKKRKSLTVYVSPKHQPQVQQEQLLVSPHHVGQSQKVEQQQQHLDIHKEKQPPQLQEQQQQQQIRFPTAAQQLRYFRRCSYNPLPAVQVKDEPMDEEDYDTMKHHDESDEMVDPTLFLERTEEEGTEPYMDTSNFSYDMSRLGNSSHVRDRTTIEVAAAVEVKEASCRACNLKFSTRANARRHERNLHPNLFELSTSTPNSTPVTKPTPALAAALELQRAAMNAAAEAAKKSATGALATPQKLRQEIVNAVNATESGFDYENPEQYQELLTDEKIVFLQQNEEFLQQYQTMTCKCCRKFYTSYKNFMAHMRKKYVTLPRNLCFNCLKLNDSKALFISHLKKRNCINLYKVMHALMAKVPSFAAAVAATAAAMPEKLRAKELLVNKIYECKLCSKHFRLKLEFRSHVYDEHADAQKKDVTPGQCGFCGLEIDDPLERKRHYNNMDCIVILRCVTCDEKFSNHQKFLDHVYAKHLVPGVVSEQQQQQQQQQQQRQQQQQQQQQHRHLASTDNSPGKKSSGFAGTSSADESRSSMHVTAAKTQYFSRMPQACPICGQQYNNYNNVLRHMESKHPDQLPQTYKCVKCGTGYPRLSNLREHMLTAHGANSEKTRATSFEYIVNADAVKAMEGAGGGGSGNSAYTGRYDYVMKDLLSITNGGTTAEDDNDEDIENSPIAKKMRIDDGNSNNATAAVSSASNLYSSYKECPICSAIFSNNIGLSNHMRSHTAAAQSAAAAAAAASTSASVAESTKAIEAANISNTIATSTTQQKTTTQQAVFKRSLELAADRRFRRMRCRICQKRFSSKKSYRRHMLDDHQIRNVQFIKCKLCDAEFAYEKGLKVHMFKIHNTLLKDEMIIKQYECDICSIVYRTEEQLLTHKKTVHGNENAHPDDYVAPDTGGQRDKVNNPATAVAAVADKSGTSTPIRANAAPLDNSSSAAPLYWYQCKYCPSNFNTNKKLAIHINSHDEFDSNDYSCKDCGNVYSGRKSLWVHRYKKHPQIAEPSECVLCRKVFFDSQMLENHIPICNRKPITATGAVAENVTPLNTFYRHKTGDDEDDDGSRDIGDEDGIPAGTLGGGEVEVTAIPAGGTKLKIKLPEVACTICGQRFTDQDLFAKHIQVHEQELYTDNPLAAMFDTGPADPNQFYLDRVNDNGEYACDICPKTFTQMTALKVHRKWHFRGDNKQNPTEGDLSASATSQTHNLQHPPGLQAVGLIPNPRPSKSLKRKRELKCEYCPSTFISNNNLRRHIYELHKSEIGNMPEPPKIETDEYLHCRKCELKFETRKEWFEHKISDARVMKPYGPFQWGCELCGEYVSRKEKLIHHIQSHMKEKNVVPVQVRKENEMKSASEVEAGSSKMNNNNNEVTDRENDGTESNSQDSQQSEGNVEYDNETEVPAKEEYEEDDAAADYVEDEEEEEDDDEIDDGPAEVDEDVDGECDEENEGEVEGDAEEDEEADAENIENIDDNANDGQNGNDVSDDDEDDDDDDEEEEDGDDVDDDDTNEVKTKRSTKNRRKSPDTTEVEDSNPYEGDEDEGDDDDNDDAEQEDEDIDADIEEDIDEDVVENATNVGKHKAPEPKKRFACDLCQVFFDTQQELQKHVKIHFLNGPGSVTLTEIRDKRINKSRSSGSSDVVTVSSS